VGGLEPHRKGSPTPDAITASVTLFVGACISAFLFFANPYLAPFETYRIVNTACLFWFPCMIIMLFLKQDLSNFGMTHGDRKFGLKFTIVAIFVMLPVLIIASLQPQFKQFYSAMDSQPLAMVGYAVRDGWTPPVRPLGMLYFEAIQGFYFFCWEFFFRGFLLFGLTRARWLGNTGAVIAQAALFALMHWSIVPSASKPPAEIASALIGGLILGWLAVRTKTFFYGFLIHWSISAILDLLLIISLLHL
jgi:membrane protease YdiL (CAAX protease family)